MERHETEKEAKALRGAERLSEAVRAGLVTAEQAQKVLDLVPSLQRKPLDTLTDEA